MVRVCESLAYHSRHIGSAAFICINKKVGRMVANVRKTIGGRLYNTSFTLRFIFTNYEIQSIFGYFSTVEHTREFRLLIEVTLDVAFQCLFLRLFLSVMHPGLVIITCIFCKFHINPINFFL